MGGTLTGGRIYLEEAQEKLKDELLLFKNPLPVAVVQTVQAHVSTLPPPLAHEQPLYAPHGHQRLWKREQQA